MAEVPTITAGELETEELLALLHEEGTIKMEVRRYGGDHRVILRYDGTTYYCDTPTTLRKSTSKKDMKRCLREMGYTSDS